MCSVCPTTSSGTSTRKRNPAMHKTARKQAVDFDPTLFSVLARASSSYHLSSAYMVSTKNLLTLRTRLQDDEGDRNNSIDSAPRMTNQYPQPLSSSISKFFSIFRRQRVYPREGSHNFVFAYGIGNISSTWASVKS